MPTLAIILFSEGGKIVGKLRSSLVSLGNILSEVDKKSDDVCERLVKAATNVSQTFGVAKEGYDSLFLYLKAKLAETFESHKKDPIKDHLDANSAKFVKGIEESRLTALKWSKVWSEIADKEGKALQADLERIGEFVADIDKQLQKKRKKLFQSKKYKEKMKAYDGQLEGLRGEAKSKLIYLRDEVLGARPASENSIERLKMTAATTVEQIEAKASIFTIKDLKELEKARDSTVTSTKKFRQRNFSKEMAMMKKWSTEADGMEEESEEN